MDLTVTQSAINLYKHEMQLQKGDFLTLFVRVGGVGSGGFSAGVYQGKPDNEYKQKIIHDISFCVSEDDEWYFDGMVIDYNSDKQEMTFTNHKIEDVTNPN